MTIQPSSISAINDAHAKCLALDGDIRASLLAKINAIRSVGLMLASEKEACLNPQEGKPKRNWKAQFADLAEEGQVHFTFTYQTGQNYINFAETLPEEVTSLPDGIASLTSFMRRTGALPKAKGKQQKASSGNEFAPLLRGVQAITIACKAWGDVQSWDTQRREQAKEQLRPLVELYDKL